MCHANITREDALTERLFQGDTGALVSHLISEQGSDPAELERLKRLIEDAKAGEGSDGDDAH